MVLTSTQTQALFEARQRPDSGLETSLQGAKSFCVTYRVGIGAFYESKEECKDPDEALCVRPALH